MSTSLSCGFVGLPNVGKSTLFNAVTKKGVPAENYPFCTIDPSVGVVAVPDPRLATLSSISHSHKLVPALISFVDIAGLVKGASQGEGLGNQFLTHIRETDAIAMVVRCFEDPNIIHVSGRVDPIQDIEIITLELVLSDLQMAENSRSRLEKQAKGRKELQPTLALLDRVLAHLNQSLSLRTLSLTPAEELLLAPYAFLTRKKLLYVCNVAESDLPSMENPFVALVRARAAQEGAVVVPICARLEEEISQLSPAEATEFLAAAGLSQSGLDRLIRATFDLLGLITFLTTGEIETRAWTIHRGTPAAQAAGKIHTDIEKGFIRAEVVSYDDYVRYNGRVAAREAGRARSEGRDYIVQDGDVILFFHN